jgi:hypothetical protein
MCLLLRTIVGGAVIRPAERSLHCLGAALILLLFCTLALIPLNAAESPAEAAERVVVIGDVHGDFDDFCLILRRAHLVDENNHWAGGNATFVQTGDLIDRGPKGREAMDLLMELQSEAKNSGGQVIPLLGNHEVMNILGDLRYVTPADYAEFADNDSEKRRNGAYREYAAWADRRAKLLAALKQPAPPGEQEWMAQHPPGFVEYREAFSRNGKYGKWIRQHHAVGEVGSVIFLHGGISPALSSMSLDHMNSKVREEIEDFDSTMQDLISKKIVLPFFTIRETLLAVQLEFVEERSAPNPTDAEFHNKLQRLVDFSHWLCMSEDGPLWFRGYDSWSDEIGAEQISKILANYHANHIVVAHTVQKGSHIRSRFDGKLFLIDTGMVYKDQGGAPSALDIQAGKFTAIYLDGQGVLFDDKSPAAAPKGN